MTHRIDVATLSLFPSQFATSLQALRLFWIKFLTGARVNLELVSISYHEAILTKLNHIFFALGNVTAVFKNHEQSN